MMTLLSCVPGIILVATLVAYAAFRAVGRADQMGGDNATDGETTL